MFGAHYATQQQRVGRSFARHHVDAGCDDDDLGCDDDDDDDLGWWWRW
jgi:hypothetical protein